MTDSEFLNWLGDRLVYVYGESETVDFVLKVRSLARKAQAEPVKWVSVAERMPDTEDEVLVCTAQGVMLDRWRMQSEAPLSFSSATIETGMYWDEHEFEEVTHWMPLSAAPGSAPQEASKPETVACWVALGEDAAGEFADWLCREMPPGTVISDPAWWAPKIMRAILAAAGGSEK